MTYKLWELLAKKGDTDVCDNTYDICFCCCEIDDINEKSDSCDRFCYWLYNNAIVTDFDNDVVDFTGLVERHYDKFNKFASEYWSTAKLFLEDDGTPIEDSEEDYKYEWVRELGYAQAGYWGNSNYTEFLKIMEGGDAYVGINCTSN